MQADKTASRVFVRMGIAPCFGLKAERMGEENLGMCCHRDGAGFPVVSSYGMKGIVGLEHGEGQRMLAFTHISTQPSDRRAGLAVPVSRKRKAP